MSKRTTYLSMYHRSLIKDAILLLPCFLAACATQPLQVERGRHAEQPASVAGQDLPQPVARPVMLPKPSGAPKVETYSVVVNNVPLQDLLFALARDARLNVDIHPLVKGRVTINALNQTLPHILERLARQVDMRYRLQGNVLVVEPDSPYLKSYNVDYVNMSRTAKSSVSIATSVSTVGSGGGGGGGNTSATEVKNEADNQFWLRLEKNIKEALQASRRVAAQQKMERLQSELKAEVDQAAQREKERQAQADKLKMLETVAKAGSGAPELFKAALEPVATPATPGATPVEDGVDVFVHPETGVITVNATEREHAMVQAMLDKVLAGARRQVLIEATIVEVELGDQYQAGIDWTLFKNQDNRINASSRTLGGNLTTSPVSVLTYTKAASSLFRDADFSATIRMLEQFGKTKVLSSPKIMALNNQTALLKVVDEKVYFTTELEIREATTTTPERRTYSSELHTVPVGMVMSVTPQISDSELITLNVRPTISRITGYKAEPAARLANAGFDNLVPEIQVRELESTLKLSSGQLAILGGLIQDNLTTQRDGVPGLSRLPWVGDLFSYRNDKAGKSELVIFMRPVAVREASIEGDLSDYRRYLPKQDFFQPKPEDEISVFESGLPAKR